MKSVPVSNPSNLLKIVGMETYGLYRAPYMLDPTVLPRSGQTIIARASPDLMRMPSSSVFGSSKGHHQDR